MTYILLILVGSSHCLYNFLTLDLGKTTLFSDNLSDQGIDLTSHVRCITTNIKVSLFFQQFVDLRGMLFHLVLYIDFIRSFPRECNVQFKFVAKILFVILKMTISLVNFRDKKRTHIPLVLIQEIFFLSPATIKQ